MKKEVAPRPAQLLMLIKRGPQSQFHKAPFHPIIICTRRHTATWEVSDSNERATLWSHGGTEAGGGWLLERYKGFNIDYGTNVKRITLWDGTEAAYAHDKASEPWSLLAGAVWWSDQPMPEWLKQMGTIYPPDDFTKESIKSDSGTCLLPQSKQDELYKRRQEIGGPIWL